MKWLVPVRVDMQFLINVIVEAETAEQAENEAEQCDVQCAEKEQTITDGTYDRTYIEGNAKLIKE